MGTKYTSPQDIEDIKGCECTLYYKSYKHEEHVIDPDLEMSLLSKTTTYSDTLFKIETQGKCITFRGVYDFYHEDRKSQINSSNKKGNNVFLYPITGVHISDIDVVEISGLSSGYLYNSIVFVRNDVILSTDKGNIRFSSYYHPTTTTWY